MHAPPWILCALVALPMACSKQQQPSVAQSDRPPASGRVAPTEDYLTTYLAFYRDWRQMTNRHIAERDALMRTVSAKYSFAETGKIAEDPDLLAMLNRHRIEMAPLSSRAPRGLMAEALNATLAGIGHMVIDAGGMTFVVERNDVALSAAREKYGDEFVDWVLAREGSIVATLSQ